LGGVAVGEKGTRIVRRKKRMEIPPPRTYLVHGTCLRRHCKKTFVLRGVENYEKRKLGNIASRAVPETGKTWEKNMGTKDV